MHDFGLSLSTVCCSEGIVGVNLGKKTYTDTGLLLAIQFIRLNTLWRHLIIRVCSLMTYSTVYVYTPVDMYSCGKCLWGAKHLG